MIKKGCFLLFSLFLLFSCRTAPPTGELPALPETGLPEAAIEPEHLYVEPYIGADEEIPAEEAALLDYEMPGDELAVTEPEYLEFPPPGETLAEELPAEELLTEELPAGELLLQEIPAEQLLAGDEEPPLEPLAELAEEAAGVAADEAAEEPTPAEEMEILQQIHDILQQIYELLTTEQEPAPAVPPAPQPEPAPPPQLPPPAPPPVVPPAVPPQVAPPPPPAPPPVPPVVPPPAPVPAVPSPVPPMPPPFLQAPELPPPFWPPAPDPLPQPPVRVIPDAPDREIVFSRVARLTVGQRLEIPFRGTGWVFLGELGNRRGLNFESRRLDIQAGVTLGQTFIFRAEEAGTYVLRFYRRDFVRDYITYDYVQVIVGERLETTVTDRVIAEPRWPLPPGPPPRPAPVFPFPVTPDPVPEILEPFPGIEPGITEEARPAIPVQIEEIAPLPPPAALPPLPPPRADPPSEYVRRARLEFDAGRIEPALVILDNMRQRFPHGTDEAWWLYGQLLEANSPSRDIRLALYFYRRLINDFPLSDRVIDAQRRIAHLERFFFNIR